MKDMLFRCASPLGEKHVMRGRTFFFLKFISKKSILLTDSNAIFLFCFVFLIHAWLLTGLGTLQNRFDTETK